MTANEIDKWLSSEIENYPRRADPEDFYKFMVCLVDKVFPQIRSELVLVLREWARQHTPTKTNLVLEFARAYRLTELKNDIEQLLIDIKDGKAFKSRYCKDVEDVLKILSSIKRGEGE